MPDTTLKIAPGVRFKIYRGTGAPPRGHLIWTDGKEERDALINLTTLKPITDESVPEYLISILRTKHDVLIDAWNATNT
jgi:hypothetical protein